MASLANGSPTKEFFVGMLTRDIDINDAILDLLDNCLDGVIRQRNNSVPKNSPDFYKGYHASITIKEDCFLIEDNCGGIPRDVAEKYAFRMGRSSEKGADDLPTVGIYGIGMKRAIFKIGSSAEVWTRNADKLYCVRIPPDWAASENNWSFPIEDSNDTILSAGGTLISIKNINEVVASNWNTEAKLEYFVDQLSKAIQQSYTYIISKGFQIFLNGNEISPLPVQLLVSDTDGDGIAPFLYQQTFGDVHVSLAVGFYSPFASQEEIDEENSGKRSTSDAGWTVICNDRVVLYNDKSHLTGWGEAGVPQYHTQFIGIRGVVVFESNNPQNLPMTTTKRGVDTSSDIYAVVKDKMRQGLKIFIDYTNRWKGQNEKERKISAKAKQVPIGTLLTDASSIEDKLDLKFKNHRGGNVHQPTLPRPTNDRPYRLISFSRSVDEIKDVVEFFYRDREHEVTPSHIGDKCFEYVLNQTHSKEGNDNATVLPPQT